VKKFFAAAKEFLDGLLALAKDLWTNPVARSAILWLVRRYLPGVVTLYVAPGVSRLTARVTRKFGALRFQSTVTIRQADDMVRRLGLEVPTGYWDLPEAERDRICNGMGPDSFNAKIRSLIDRMTSAVVWCSFPHDVAYCRPFNDGTYLTWRNLTMLPWERNSAKCVENANLTAPHWWTRAYNRAVAGLVIDALRAGAYQAWIDAYKRGET